MRYCICPTLLYRSKQAVIIGDPNQLKHISSIPIGKDNQLLDRYGLLDTPSYSFSINSLFDKAAQVAERKVH